MIIVIIIHQDNQYHQIHRLVHRKNILGKFPEKFLHCFRKNFFKKTFFFQLFSAQIKESRIQVSRNFPNSGQIIMDKEYYQVQVMVAVVVVAVMDY